MQPLNSINNVILAMNFIRCFIVLPLFRSHRLLNADAQQALRLLGALPSSSHASCKPFFRLAGRLKNALSIPFSVQAWVHSAIELKHFSVSFIAFRHFWVLCSYFSNALRIGFFLFFRHIRPTIPKSGRRVYAAA